MNTRMRPGSTGRMDFAIHCPQCGRLLLHLQRGEAMVHCSACGTDLKAAVRGNRLTIFRLDLSGDSGSVQAQQGS